jgi:hypothetical protein
MNLICRQFLEQTQEKSISLLLIPIFHDIIETEVSCFNMYLSVLNYWQRLDLIYNNSSKFYDVEFVFSQAPITPASLSNFISLLQRMSGDCLKNWQIDICSHQQIRFTGKNICSNHFVLLTSCFFAGDPSLTHPTKWYCSLFSTATKLSPRNLPSLLWINYEYHLRRFLDMLCHSEMYWY